MGAQWGKIAVKEVVSALGGRQIYGSPDKLMRGLSTDSRTMLPGQMFLALRGERYDGHNFLSEAVDAGAAGVIVESDTAIHKELTNNNLIVITVSSTLKALGDLAMWWRRQWGGRVIAITGSNGKSTTKEMAASILSLKANTMKSPGNFNNLIGLPLAVLSLEEGHEMAVLEMGMNRPGEIARLTQIAEPDIGVITNVARAHLEGLGDLDGVVKAKGELLEVMSKKSTAILNGDDGSTVRLASTFQGPIVTFGLGKMNQVRAGNIKRIGACTQAFNIYMDNERIRVKINLPGIHNVFNALGGAAIALCSSTSKELIAQGLEDFRPLKGRFQIIDLKDGIQIIDDTYNSNPSSLIAALLIGTQACTMKALRVKTIELSESDMENAATVRTIAKNLLTSWPTWSGLIHCGLGTSMKKLPIEAIEAWMKLDVMAANYKENPESLSDGQLGCSIGLRILILSRTVQEAIEQIAPELLSAVGTLGGL